MRGMKKLLASLGALCLLVSSVSGLSVNVTAGNAPQALMLQAFDGTVGDSYTYTWGGTSAITELTYTETGAVSGTALQATLKQGSDASDAAQGLQLRLGNPADGSYDEVREQAASKKYLMWHINVSDVPEESRREDFTDAAGNPCFGVYVTLITSDAWYQHNGGYTSRVELMPDAGGWTTGVTSGEWICLPYGFSGWVRTELSDYKGMWEDDPAMDLNKIQDYLYLTFSQMNSDVMVQVDSWPTTVTR